MHPILEPGNNGLQQMREEYCKDEGDEGTSGQPQHSENAGNEEDRYQDRNRSPVQESHKYATRNLRASLQPKISFVTKRQTCYVTVSALYLAMSPVLTLC